MLTYKATEQKKLSFEFFRVKMLKEYEYLQKYLEINSVKIEETKNEIEITLLSEIEGDPESQTLVNELYENKIRSILSFYYHSSVTLVHSFFESQLYHLCKLIQQETQSKFDVTLLKGGDYIKTGLEYLKLTTQLNEDIINSHKPRLGLFQKLRNKIIHENSTYKDESDKDQLINGFGKNIEIYEFEKKFFITSDILPKDYLEKVKLFFQVILEHLENTYFQIPIMVSEEPVDLPF